MAAVVALPRKGFGPPLGIELPSRMLLVAMLAIAAAVAAGVGAVPVSADPSGASASGAVVDPGIPSDARVVEVIVQGQPGVAPSTVAEAVQAVGGEVVTPLPIVEGASIRVRGDRVDALARQDGIAAVTLDRDVRFETVTYDETGTASAFVGASGAHEAWRSGHLGQGVGVAVIDTGVSEMQDLKGRIVHGPDLSGEGTLVDTYGHGTVMAGIIGGSGADSAGNKGGAYTGIAPEAHVVAVKVAGANGAADVTTLLQGLHWVSAYQHQFDIRVLNLSWGTASTQDPSSDPLNYAVQRLWKQGIVVVVAAGNSGPTAGTITKPGDDPMIITVGAFNDAGTGALADDEGVSWSSTGPTAHGLAKPDVVASGRRLVATRSHGSTVANENPKALVDPSYIRGSGSSQAAAVTSGVAALLLQARPELTPDQVKALLTGTADPLPAPRPDQHGKGRVDLAEALTADPGPASWQQSDASGLGSVESSRGGRNVETDCGRDGTVDLIKGEIDVRCEAWNGSSWSGSSWSGDSWTGSSWSGSSWSGSSWSGSSWSGSSWSGSSWSGGAWTTGAYDTDDDLLLTAWWGTTPPASVRIPGESPTSPTLVGRRL
jgi:serine protease AprX